ncbi:hypothetical protein AB0383_19550 [Amycolatopsis sp. NPDC051373]|uniref:hypothetical protein n=1 Tax=Amycolatopsis sp. NPDC051373 TaxID=3155801 RepID=UPI00344F4310
MSKLFTRDELVRSIESFAEREAQRQTALWSPRGICDDTDEEFTAKLTARIIKVATRTLSVPLPPEVAPRQHVFGFGEEIPLALTKWDLDQQEFRRSGWFWAHDFARSVGWDPRNLSEHLAKMRGFDLSQQRDADEEAGVIGWDYLSHLPMEVQAWHGEHDCPSSGRGEEMRWWGDLWLIDTGRIMALMSSSPEWGREFMDNAIPLMARAMLETNSDGAEAVPAYTGDGQTAGTLADMFERDTLGLTPEELGRRAMRGPALDNIEEDQA